MTATFDRETLDLLDREREVDIITGRPDGGSMQTTIWVVVDGDDAFIRSWRGERAHWFQAALDRPVDTELVVDGRRVAVRPVLATDERSVARCSSGLERKYAGAAETASMVREDVLGTTLRLEPR